MYQFCLAIILRLEVMIPFIATRDSIGFGTSAVFAVLNYFAERRCRECRTLLRRLGVACLWSLGNGALFTLLMCWTFRGTIPVFSPPGRQLTSVWSIAIYVLTCTVIARFAAIVLDRLAEKLAPEVSRDKHQV